MQTGLTIVSDFTSLHVPTDMKREKFKELSSKFRHYSTMFMDRQSFVLNLKVTVKVFVREQNHIQHGLLLNLHLIPNGVYLLLSQFAYQLIKVFLSSIVVQTKFKLVNIFS